MMVKKRKRTYVPYYYCEQCERIFAQAEHYDDRISGTQRKIIKRFDKEW